MADLIRTKNHSKYVFHIKFTQIITKMIIIIIIIIITDYLFIYIYIYTSCPDPAVARELVCQGWVKQLQIR